MLTGGNINDCVQLPAVLEAIHVPRLGAGRPRTRPAHLIADKGYSTNKVRAYLRRRGIGHTIPERADHLAARARRGHRRRAFDQQTYRRRNVVERAINRLKQWRGIATRYDKNTTHYQAGITLASLILWLTT